MKFRSTAVAVFALAWLAVSVLPAAAQDLKKVRGTVVSAAAASLTVSVEGKDMTFAVDAKTKVIAKGGSTAERSAGELSKSGPVLADLIKKGDGVEVSYHDLGGGKLHAAEIRGGITATSSAPAPTAAAAAAPKSMTASGEVTAVGAASVTVKSGADSWVFAVAPETDIIGTGLGHMTKDKAEVGKKMTLADAVGVGDQVTVVYTEADGRKAAKEVRVTKKKM